MGRTVLSYLARAMAWAMIVVAAAAVLAAVILPRLAGATPYAVLSGSMEPAYPPGTLVVVRPVEPDAVRVGDAITYQRESGKPAVVTHRVTQVRVTVTGEQRWTTQGDANAIPDVEPVRAEQIRGTVWYSVPHLGHVQVWGTGAQREIVASAVGVVLLGYALLMFGGAWRDRARPVRSGREAVEEVVP